MTVYYTNYVSEENNDEGERIYCGKPRKSTEVKSLGLNSLPLTFIRAIIKLMIMKRCLYISLRISFVSERAYKGILREASSAYCNLIHYGIPEEKRFIFQGSSININRIELILPISTEDRENLFTERSITRMSIFLEKYGKSGILG